MSSQQNGLNGQHLASQADRRYSTSSPHAHAQDRYHGGSELREDIQMDDGRMSGELEGSTLGSGSRDSERGEQKQHRTQSSGGFLLDSAFIPSTQFPRTDHHREHQSESVGVAKRRASEPEIVVPKRKSRRPWHRHKHLLRSSPLATAVTNASTAEEIPRHTLEMPGFGTAPNSNRRIISTAATSAAVGLDTDPAQIVNLALNLSESRRRNYAGRFPSSPMPAGRRIGSSGQPSFTLGDNHAQKRTGNYWQHQSHAHSSGYTAPENIYQSFPHSAHRITRAYSDTSGPAPIAVEDDSHITYEFSDATLARAEKARNHFMLFFEYLRLLPHLPPLRHPTQDVPTSAVSTAEDDVPSGRVYNPLQCIRNRKVRFREKCPIDTESEGWYDVARVHRWVNAIEANDERRHDDADQCVELPLFQHGQKEGSPTDERDVERSTASPSSSTRRVVGTSIVKPRRPRVDWVTSPAELLADAAWLEDGLNKTKIVDKDGNGLYPESVELKRTGWKDSNLTSDDGSAPEQQKAIETGELGSPAALPSFQHSAARDNRHSGRGRHRHRLQGSLHLTPSPSGSDKGGKSRWRKSVVRSSSSSSDSTDDESSRGRARHSRWKKRLRGTLEGTMQDSRMSGSLTRESRRSRDRATDNTGKTPISGLMHTARASSPESRIDRGGRMTGRRDRGSISSAASTGDKVDARISLEEMDSTAPNSPSHGGYFPSIAVNLSPPSSRSPSPVKKALPRIIGSLHERNRSKQRNKLEEEPTYESSPESSSLRKRKTSDGIDPLDRTGLLEPSPMPDCLPSGQDGRAINESRRYDGPKGNKPSGQQESKLRGIFRGGRIAEIVGNEVSKVGDLIRKKDTQVHTRKSSAASSVVSDYHDSDDDKANGDLKSGSKTLLKPLPTFSDDTGRLSRRETERDFSKTFNPNLPTFTSPFKQDYQNDNRKLSDFNPSIGPQHGASGEIDDAKPADVNEAAPSNFSSRPQDATIAATGRGGGYSFGPALNVFREQNRKKGQIKDDSETYGLTRPPVTGLANVDVSTTPPPRKKRPTLSAATRAWSISDRSITTIGDPDLTDKREIERVRALLLSSGIKAREICRRAETVRSPAPEFLVRSLADPHSPVPRVPRFEEFDCAARNLLRTFEDRKSSFQQSMNRFSSVTSPSLKSELENLETLISQSLTPRVRAAAVDAENLSTQLNTTSTLAVKQLSDALDKGIRKRNRRFRWVRRTGFVLLEWVLVGVMWWVWLIVMIFKVTRGVWRGVISGIRWVLWL